MPDQGSSLKAEGTPADKQNAAEAQNDIEEVAGGAAVAKASAEVPAEPITAENGQAAS